MLFIKWTWCLVLTVSSAGLSNHHGPALVSWSGGLCGQQSHKAGVPERKTRSRTAAAKDRGQHLLFLLHLQTANRESLLFFKLLLSGVLCSERSTLESGNRRDYSFYEVQLVITSTCDRNQMRRRVGRKAELGENTRSCVRLWVQSEHMCLRTWSSGRSAWADSAGLALLDKVWGWGRASRFPRTSHSQFALRPCLPGYQAAPPLSTTLLWSLKVILKVRLTFLL